MNDAVIVSAVRTAVGKAPNGTLRGTRPDELAATAIAEALRRAPRHRAGRNRRRDSGLRDAGGRAGPERRADCEPARGHSGVGVRRHRQPLLLVGAAGDCVRGRTHHVRLGLDDRRGRHRVDEPRADGRQQDRAESRADRPLSRRLSEHRASSPRITRANRASPARHRTPSRCAAISARSPPSTPAGSPTRSSRSRTGSGTIKWRVRITESENRDLRRRRGTAPRHVGRGAGEAAAGLPRERHGHGRQLVADERRRLRRRRDVRRSSQAARSVAAGAFVRFATAGVEPERFGLGPVPAIHKVLKLAGLTLDEIDLVELNEAFAAQVLACLKELPIDPDRLNVNGGAIALGHPLGCTGAKLTTTLLYEMKRRNGPLRPRHDVRGRRHGRGGHF